MKTTTKTACLATLALGLAASVHAGTYNYGDLLVGFDGSGNDKIFDLGQRSSLSAGETWNVGVGLGSRYGLVGGTLNGAHIYASSFDSSENFYDPTGNGSTAISNVRTIAGGSSALVVGGSRTTSPGDTTGWTYQTDQAPGTPGNTFFNNYFNPNVGANSLAYFFDNLNTGSVIVSGAFSYDSAAGVLTYIPEPGSAALFALGGLLAFGFRLNASRKF